MGQFLVRIGICLATALPTVNGPERSVSRESVRFKHSKFKI
jgi:hypothetical protein